MKHFLLRFVTCRNQRAATEGTNQVSSETSGFIQSHSGTPEKPNGLNLIRQAPVCRARVRVNPRVRVVDPNPRVNDPSPKVNDPNPLPRP